MRDTLAQCPLFDLLSGPHCITDDTDYKHDGKGFKRALKAVDRGVQIVSHTFYAADWRRIFAALGYTEKQIKEMLEPDDEQNVEAMVMLFQALAKLSDVTAETLSGAGLGVPALLGVKANELQLIGAIAACYVFLFTANDKSIHEHLVNLAELQFLLFVLFRRNGTSFLPGQNYSNTSSMIRAKFKSVALAQAEGITVYYIFLDCDDLLEGFFGVLRTMSGTHSNFDMLQLEEKAGAAMQVCEIYTRRPEWDRGSRRLSGSLDHWNTRSWTGCVDPSKVNVPQAWAEGMGRARGRFCATGLIPTAQVDFAAIAREVVGEGAGGHPTVLMPRGVRVGAQLPST